VNAGLPGTLEGSAGMFQRLREKRQDEGGFTLIELLVVVLIIAILAAIAIPVFLRQREKAYIADAQSTVRNAATAIESYATGNEGSYDGFETVGVDEYDDFIARLPASQTAGFDVVTATATEYCMQVADTRLVGHAEWATAHFDSAVGKPAGGACS
jgi:type IV pilus assembly protein PilA